MHDSSSRESEAAAESSDSSINPPAPRYTNVACTAVAVYLVISIAPGDVERGISMNAMCSKWRIKAVDMPGKLGVYVGGKTES